MHDSAYARMEIAVQANARTWEKGHYDMKKKAVQSDEDLPCSSHHENMPI